MNIKHQRLAHHEAAHAVADVRFGFLCDRLDLESGADVEKHGHAAAIEENPDHQGTTEGWMISMFAGYVAEIRLDPSRENEAREWAKGDFVEAQSIAAKRGEEIEPWLTKTHAFIEKNWIAVEAVARELLARNELDGVEVELIVRASDGDASAAKGLEDYRHMKTHSPEAAF